MILIRVIRHRLYYISFDILANQNANNVYSDADVGGVDKNIVYSKYLLYVRMLELNKGGFADSVEIKKLRKKNADLFYFSDGDHLQSIVELTNDQAKDVKGWRLLKDGKTTESMFEAMKALKNDFNGEVYKGQRLEPAQREIKNLMNKESTAERSRQQSLQDGANKIGRGVSSDYLHDETAVALLKIFQAAMDSTVNEPAELQQFWETNASNVIMKCGRRVGASDFQTSLKLWALSGGNS